MRIAYGMIGLGILVIAGGLYLINHPFTSIDDTNEHFTIPNSKKSLMSDFALTSSAFQPNESIPSQYTCEGDKSNPPLSIEGAPTEAKSLVLLMNDPDVPKARRPDGNFDHWVLFNIPPATREIATGATIGILGANGAGANEYRPPCPPKEYEPSEHRYFFKLYALDVELPLETGASKADVEKAMMGHVIAETQLMGKYKKK